MKDTMTRLRAFARVQTLLTKIELRVKATQGSFYVAAFLFVLLALVMINLAGFLALSQKVGYAWSALVFTGIDVVLAGILAWRAGQIQPGPEVESATQVRDLLLDEITADVEVVRDEFMQAREDVQRIRSGFSAITGGVKGLAPVVDLLTGALRGSKKKKGKSA